MSKDDLGDRMKIYEATTTSTIFDKNLPVYARIDGRSFSKLTRNCMKPFDHDISNAMLATTIELVEATGAFVGYTQSDEISLGYLAPNPESEIFFGGKMHKLISVLASMTTSYFTTHVQRVLADKQPTFDARAFQLPNTTELVNAFLWRIFDCHRNAIQGLGQAHFSHRELQGLSNREVERLLNTVGIDASDYPFPFLYGSLVVRQPIEYLREDGTTYIRKQAMVVSSPLLSQFEHLSEFMLTHNSGIKLPESADSGTFS